MRLFYLRGAQGEAHLRPLIFPIPSIPPPPHTLPLVIAVQSPYTILMDDAELMAIMAAQLKPTRGGGRPSTPFTVGTPRELTEADLGALIHPEPMGSKAAPIQRIRSTHHRLAQLIADGLRQVEVSLITGYSQSRISQLLVDPAFQELVAHYRNQKEAVFIDAQARLADTGITALEIIRDRMEENPDSLQVRELLEVMSQTLDRSIAPKRSETKIDGNMSFSWAKIVEESIKQVKQQEKPPIIIDNAAE